jgi:hypothetical protein
LTNFSDQCKDDKIGGSFNRATQDLNSGRELILSLCTSENDLRQQAGQLRSKYEITGNY